MVLSCVNPDQRSRVVHSRDSCAPEGVGRVDHCNRPIRAAEESVREGARVEKIAGDKAGIVYGNGPGAAERARAGCGTLRVEYRVGWDMRRGGLVGRVAALSGEQERWE